MPQKAITNKQEAKKRRPRNPYYATHFVYPVLRFAGAFGGGSGGALLRHRSSHAGCRPIARQPVDDARAGQRRVRQYVHRRMCTEGLASGQLTKTDCSVNWKDSDGRVYCFSSEESKAAFLKDTSGNLQKAREFFAAKQASAGKATKEFTEDDVNK